MRTKGIEDENFINYKVPSMFIATCFCDFKCEKESGANCCQNSSLSHARIVAIDTETIIHRYLKNPITKAIVFGGLEPLEQMEEIFDFIEKLRVWNDCADPVVIYTGYNKDEILKWLEKLKQFENIIVKYGRYIPNQPHHYDEILGVYLASNNQYAEVIS